MAIIRERRRQPGDDIISALVHVEKEGDRLSEREMLNMVRLLLDVSNETTTNLIGNDMLALLGNPDQLQRLRDDPSLIEDAIDKLLRFDSPVQTGFKYALADGEVRGAPVPQGPDPRSLGRRRQPGSGHVRGSGPTRCRAPGHQPPVIRTR